MMGFGGGGLFMLLFWGIVLVAIVVALRSRWTGEPGQDAEPGDSALEILGRRYARGEIDREEFEAKKRDLRESRR